MMNYKANEALAVVSTCAQALKLVLSIKNTIINNNVSYLGECSELTAITPKVKVDLSRKKRTNKCRQI